MGAPLLTPVTGDNIYVFRDASKSIKVPNFFAPKTMHNHGNYIISLGKLCRWLAEQAENLGVEIFPGFAAAEVLYGDSGEVLGIATGDMGIGHDGEHKGSYMQGMELRAKYTLFSEGCRGHLGKKLIDKYQLDTRQRSPALRYRYQRILESTGRTASDRDLWFTPRVGLWMKVNLWVVDFYITSKTIQWRWDSSPISPTPIPMLAPTMNFSATSIIRRLPSIFRVASALPTVHERC